MNKQVNVTITKEVINLAFKFASILIERDRQQGIGIGVADDLLDDIIDVDKLLHYYNSNIVVSDSI